jgi:2,5-diamino-6-(ribosylamino)-4(3H)-pyrimidinone 5'-phosphate reductase
LKEIKLPYIILSAAMTIDGKIASKVGDPELSDDQDWKEVHKLRSQVDGIIVGKNTILNDNPKLHIKFHKHAGYKRIVVDSNLSIPINSNVITFQPEIYPTIICIAENASLERIKEFESKGVKILKSGKGKRVDILELMPILYDLGIQKVLLEGGGTLNWSFIEKNLVDEIRLTIAPWIIGGKTATSLVEGTGFETMAEGSRFELLEIQNRDNYVVLRYKKI